MVRKGGPVLAVFALLVSIIAIAAMTSSQVTQLPVPKGSVRPFTPPPMPEFDSSLGRSTGSGDTQLIETVLLVLAFLVVAVGLAFLIRFLIRQRLRLRLGRFQVRRVTVGHRVEVATVEPEEVDSAIQQGLDELDDQTVDPRRAVIACWVRLERLAAAAGARRAASDTPTELIGRLLAEHDVSEAVLHQLASLYRRARYAPAEVDEAMRTEARATLEQLRSELVVRP